MTTKRTKKSTEKASFGTVLKGEFAKLITEDPNAGGAREADNASKAMAGLSHIGRNMAVRIKHSAQILAIISEHMDNCAEALGHQSASLVQEHGLPAEPESETVYMMPHKQEQSFFIVAACDKTRSYYGPYTHEAAVEIVNSQPGLDWDLVASVPKDEDALEPDELDPEIIDQIPVSK